jgi:hypothetical protein
MTAYEPIASFETADGAAAATAELVELGYDEHEVGIEPHDYEVVRPAGLRAILVRHLARAAIAGAVVMATISGGVAVGAAGLRSVLEATVIGVVAGAAAGAIVAMLRYLRARATSYPTTANQLRPGRYDVIVNRDARKANHEMARWWDPAAPRATRRAVA